MNTQPSFRLTRSLKSILAFALIAACSLQTSSSEVIVADEQRFSPSTGQPIFPAGNLNVFKQYSLGFDVNERIGDKVEINLLFTTLEFGGELIAGFNAQFGIEVGLCLGGNADFDLGFIPTVMLPERYPSEIPIPITVSEGLLPDSHFTTTFPPLGKMYADLIMDLGARLKAEACVFGCFTPIDFDFSTCDIPALQPSGVKLFNESVRCDPALDAKKYCAIELASFNRHDDNKARLINVSAGNLPEFLAKPYLEFAPSISLDKTFTASAVSNTLTVSGSHTFVKNSPVRVSGNPLPAGLEASRTYYVQPTSVTGSVGPVFFLSKGSNGSAVDITSNGSGKVSPADIDTPDDPLSGRYGTLSIAAPTINTDSTGSDFNTAESLKSSGAEDVLGVGINLAQMFSDFILPPGFPALSDSGSLGPIDWNYTLASLNLGPAIQLQMDFEMDWDLSVSEMTFRVPGTTTPKPVNLVSPAGVRIGTGVSKLTDIAPAGTYHLTNCGSNALPLVSLITDLPLASGQKPVEVEITYVLKPRLKTNVSLPIIGRLNYEVLSAGASISRVGDLQIGPLLEGEHKFKFGEFNVYEGDASAIESVGSGHIKFTMLSSGPPSFEWNTAQYPGNNDHLWTGISSGTTNWKEVVSVPAATNSFPGMGGPNSDAMIHRAPQSNLEKDISIATLCLNSDGSLRIRDRRTANGSATLSVRGIVDNNGVINLEGTASTAALKMDSPTAVLCGNGTLTLSGAAALQGYTGPQPFAFCNYNDITGAGQLMDVRGQNPAGSTVHNNGIITANGSAAGSNRFTVTLKLDDFPEETTWEIRNPGGAVVASGGPYARPLAGQTVSSSVTLNTAGTYTFNIFDSFGDGNCCQQGIGTFSLTNGQGNVISEGSFSGASFAKSFSVSDPKTLKTSAELIVNENGMQATNGNTLLIEADRFESRNGSYALSLGANSRLDFRCKETNHAGTIAAAEGSLITIEPIAFGMPSIWNGGQSMRSNCGIVRASSNASISISGTTVNGGCFAVRPDGTLFTSTSNFNGAAVEIGNLNQLQSGTLSGLFVVFSSTNQVFTKSCVNNFGTMRVHGSAEFVDTVLFANHGKIEIKNSGNLRIRENTIATPGASMEARIQPGSANTTREAILGGIWDIAGTLTLDGCSFTTIGGNIAPAATGSGSIDELPTGNVMPVSTFDPQDDESRVLAMGKPATVILRGDNWSFPALRPLSENHGSLQILDGADLQVNTIFSTDNELIISGTSSFTNNGTFTQRGPNSRTTISPGGTLDSLTDDYVICGGTFTGSGNGVLGVVGGVLTSGTKLRVESPIIDTNETVYQRVPTDVDAGPVIASIASGAEMTIHGSNVKFRGLTENLRTVNGKFTLSGGGTDNAAFARIANFTGDTITNTGEIHILGYRTHLFTAGITQSGVNSKTVVGPGAKLTAFGSPGLVINGGECVVRIGARPSLDQAGLIIASHANFNNRLTIDFVDDLTEPGATVDIGDTWVIIPSTISNNISGLDFVTYTLNGSTIPAGWLPNGARLEVIHIPTNFGPRGLAVRVAPVSGFISYDNWASSAGLDPDGFLADPLRSIPQPGETNLSAFAYGVDGVSKFSSSNGQNVSFIKDASGNSYPVLSFTRPFGTKANYDPYYSSDLVTWRRAPMIIRHSNAPTPATGEMETVTLESSYPFTEKKLFFRLGARPNPADFDVGEIPDKELNWSSSLSNFSQSLENNFAPVSYVIEPGKTLYFLVTGSIGESSIYGGTAADGVTRNFSYRDTTILRLACVHAGLLKNNQQGIIKLTFTDTQTTPFIGSTQNAGTPNAITSLGSSVLSAPYSYRIELVKLL